MSLKFVQYCSDSRLACTGCLPADVIACVRPEIVAPQLLCGQGLAESPYAFSYIEATVVAVSKDPCSNKFKYTLEYDSAQIVVGVLEVLPSDISGLFCKGCLTSWVEDKVGREIYITENEDLETVLVTQHGCVYVLPNANGNNAYVYVAYASDDIGTDFTLVPDVTSTYINFLSTNAILMPPVLADFDPLQWVEFQGPQGIQGIMGPSGPAGTNGTNGDNAYVYVAYASDDTGTDFTLVPDITSTYINFLSTNLVLTPPVLGDFDPAQWVEFVGPQGIQGIQGIPGPQGPAGSSGTSPIGSIVEGFWQTAPTDHLPMIGDTLGNAVSGATYASASYSDLFNYLWNNLADAQAPVSSGRGVSAVADFAAGKTITILDTRGKSALGQAVSGVGSVTGSSFGAIEHNHTVAAHYHSTRATGADVNIIASGTHITAITHDHPSFNTAIAGTHTHGITDPGHEHTVGVKGSGAVAGTARVMGATLVGTDGVTTSNAVRLSYTGITTTIANSAHSHAIDVPAFTGNSSSTGSHVHQNSEFAGRVGLVTGGQNGDVANNTGNASHACFVVKYYIRYQ